MAEKELFDLLKIGLTEGEAKVYLALVGLGSSTVGPIVKKARVAYSNVYDILNRLIEKGIVSFIIKDKTKYFQAVSPSNLLDYLDKKEKEIQKQKEDLQKVLKEIEKLQENKPEQEAEIFLGKKGLKTAYEKLLSKVNKNDEDTYFYIHEKEYAEEADNFYFSLKHLIKKVNFRGIVNEEKIKSEFTKRFKNSKTIKIRFANFPIPGNIEVCKDKLLLVSWKKPIIAVLIHSQSIADNFKRYFESVWKVSR
jgi:sugar-specific transcriptional regulator TrmB